jgi:hypothetical protein
MRIQGDVGVPMVAYQEKEVPAKQAIGSVSDYDIA